MEGIASVYYGSATSPSVTANWTAESDQVNAWFGINVASAGDVNGDGYSDVIVGSPNFSNGQTSEGRAFVFYGSASGLSLSFNWTAESDQANALFGQSVAAAGDVNGDGFSDVIVGAPNFDNGQTDEGRAYVFNGSSSGLSVIATWTAEIDDPSASFGRSVASAGDVNGDGYSDVIVGIPYYGGADAGMTLVYHGSATGPNTSANNLVVGLNAGDNFGYSVSGAGDLNADGYSDVIVGAKSWNTFGAAFFYFGNNVSYGSAKKNNLRLYNQDLITPIQQLNITQPNLFGAGLFARSPIGRVKGKLVWEVKAQGVAFSGNPITNSTAYLDKQTSFTNLGITGTELKSNVQKVGSKTNKIRTRVEYDKVTAITGQVYGPWRYPAGYTMGAYGQNSVPLPVTLLSFNGRYAYASDVQLNWITTNEINMHSYFIERSIDGVNFTDIGTLSAKGQGSNRSDYTFTDRNPGQYLLYYRLRLLDKNGDIAYTKTITLGGMNGLKSYIAPNPVRRGMDAQLVLKSAGNYPVSIQIYNISGQLVSTEGRILRAGRNEIKISTRNLAAGTYVLTVLQNGTKENYRMLVQ